MPEDLTLPDGSTVELDETDLEFTVDNLGVVTAHPNKAASRLIERFRKPAYKAFLRACALEVQEAENMLWNVLLSRYVDHAEGVSLNYIGNRVGEPRASLNDPDYRVRIKARILINRSKGRAEDVLGIIRALGSHGRWRNTHRASARVELLETPANASTAAQIADLLGQAVSGGVRLHVSMPTSATPFRLGHVGGDDNGGILDSVQGGTDAPGLLTHGQAA